MDNQEKDKQDGAFAVPEPDKRRYISGPQSEKQPGKKGTARRYIRPRSLQKDKEVILETQLIDTNKVREKAEAKTASMEEKLLQVSKAGVSDKERPVPASWRKSQAPPEEDNPAGSALSAEAVQMLENIPRSDVYPDLTEMAVLEIRAAGKKGDYSILEPVAKGAESILYKARSGQHIFCVKAIRNRWDTVLGNSKTRNNQEKLQDVSYATKTRHLHNEYDVARALYNAQEEMPVVKVMYLRKVTRFGLELGYDLLMEYIQGHDLSERNILKRFGVEDKIRLMYQATQALSYVHKRKLIHLDIKPSNFMLTRDGKVRLIDFGISVFSGFKGRSITGTTGYLSPEQVAKETLNEATDIFALGVTFAIFFGGKPLSQNLEELLQRSVRRDARFHLESGNVSAIADLPELSDRPLIAEIIRNCSILKRENRIPNCHNLLMQLQQAAKSYGLVLE
jgi:serine/threonine protein kinase